MTHSEDPDGKAVLEELFRNPKKLRSKARADWNLDKLSADLARVKKGKELTEAEERNLLGLLCGYRPEQIAEGSCTEVATVSVNLCNTIYRYVERLTGQERNAVRNWRYIVLWLEAAGYRSLESWDEAPIVPVFYGRDKKLEQLEQMVIGDSPNPSLSQGCRLIMLVGREGVGKTALVIKLADRIQPLFHYRIWQSLRHAPQLESVIDNCLKLLSKSLEEQAGSLDTKVSSLIQCLRNRRCLVVLDGLNTIFEGGQLAGHYKEGYENYGEFFQRIGQEPHQSCVLVTSRELTREIRVLEGNNRPTRVFDLEGLETEAARQILREAALLEETSEPNYWGQLIERYKGNPLSLKLVTSRIKDLHGGEVSTFLKRGPTVFLDIKTLHERNFERLSSLEQEILRALAKATVSLSQLEEVLSASSPSLDDALASLLYRSLVEKNIAGQYTLSPDFMEYVNTYKS